MTGRTLAGWRGALRDGTLDGRLTALYGDAEAARARLLRLCDAFEADFGDEGELGLFTAPGRTEIGGNHTDHNWGRVLCGAVNLDAAGLARRSDSGCIRLHSQGFAPNEVELSHLAPQPGESVSNALIRGLCRAFRDDGRDIGGLDAVTQSDVTGGSGLSSSAAFENLVGTMLDHLYGEGTLDAPRLARFGQFAENVYINKPSGLMDQTASAVGGLLTIDFADPQAAQIRRIGYDFSQSGHDLCVTGPIGSHADLTPAYASIPEEMALVAGCFGKRKLREIAEQAFMAALPELIGRVPDRALLRALHFYAENRRVEAQTEALERGDFDRFLREVNASGRSSFQYLQNVTTGDSQGLGLALALTERFLAGTGACRVHGGGFAGTIQAFVPKARSADYIALMERVFGAGHCLRLWIRAEGAGCIAG